MVDDILATQKNNNAKLFGRKWKISILIPKTEIETSADKNKYVAYVVSNSDYEDQSLDVSFKIEKFGWKNPNFSEVIVYNLNPQTENLTIRSGARILVEAGYVNGDYGVICDSNIFQPIWEREDTVTTKVTFKCIDAMDIIYENHVSAVSGPLARQKNCILGMAAGARRPFNITKISEDMGDAQLARGKIFFDSPTHYMRKYAQQYGTVMSTVDREVYLDRPQDPIPQNLTKQALVLSPGKGGLVDVPQQTQDGITFTCLLNPKIRVFSPEPMLVKIDNQIIRQMAIQYGSSGFSRLDEDGIYRVIGVTHSGSTRGNEWYTMVTGCNQSMEGTLATMYKTQKDVPK
jgi:hypothetical protein